MRWAAALLCAAWPAVAAAQPRPLTVGLYAPSAPFRSPGERLEFVSALATHLAHGLGLPVGVGRQYARAADFAAAVKRGDLEFAVVDAAYFAASPHPWPPLAAAVRRGATSTSWDIFATGPTRSLLDLRGKAIIVPSVGAREEAFVYQVLLDGELAGARFARVSTAPDSLSALMAVSIGRADGALVPAGLPLPERVKRLATATRLPWPVFVALPAARAGAIEKAQQSILSFEGSGLFERFQRASSDTYRALAARFLRLQRRGPMAVPPPKLPLDALLAGRSFSIQHLDLTAFWAAP